MKISFEQRLQRLEDAENIRNLIAHYGPLADAGDADAVAQLWTVDGVYSVGGFAEACGQEAIAALITGGVHQQYMASGVAHMLGPLALRIDGNQAAARGHSLVVLHGAGGAYGIIRASANLWQLARGDAAGFGGWRVTRRDNHPLNGDAAARALFANRD